jgi:hypothetical protein
MTQKRRLKDLIQERMEKYGERYTTARSNVLRSQGRLCPACNGMLSAETVRQIFEPDDDATEGQVADYLMEVESGIGDNWTEEVGVVWCPRCETPFDRVLRELGLRFSPEVK